MSAGPISNPEQFTEGLPFPFILRRLKKGFVVPFLGAGASQVAAPQSDAAILPSGSRLAETLADDVNLSHSVGADRQDLAKVSSYYEDNTGRIGLREILRGVFVQPKYRANSLHRFLAKVASNLLIVTTNYDTLLEQAFNEIEKPYDLVVYPADGEDFAKSILWWPHGKTKPEILKPNGLDASYLGKTNIIYKIHGSVRADADTWDSFVITEEDYVRFLSRMDSAVPPCFQRYFSQRHFLFLGYSLRDWNMRVMLKKVSKNGSQSWAINKGAPPFDQVLWARRGVRIFDQSLEDFVSLMETEFETKKNEQV